MGQRNEIILVMGAPRSGTTFVNSILNTHPSIAITNEANLVIAADALAQTLFRPRQASTRLRSPRETWALDESPSHIPGIEDVLFSMFKAYCCSLKPNRKIRLFGDKVPTYYRYNLKEFAQKLGVDLRVIFLTRNPVDVVSSMLRRSQNTSKGLDSWRGPPTPAAALNEWMCAWNQRSLLKKNECIMMLDLNYDAAIAYPKEMAAVLSAFLNVDDEFDIKHINTSEVSRVIHPFQMIKYLPEIKELDDNWGNLPLLLDGYDRSYREFEITRLRKILSGLANLKRLRW